MENASIDFINLISEWVESPGFIYGVSYVIVTMLLVTFLDLPYAIMQLVLQRKISHQCNLRCGGLLFDPCHYKACPAHGSCPYYKPRDFWAFFKSFFQRKKDGAT